jgi:hypothetical protein
MRRGNASGPDRGREARRRPPSVRGASFPPEEEVLAGPPIDRGERLIEQHQLGILNDQAGEEDALDWPAESVSIGPALKPVETDGR